MVGGSVLSGLLLFALLGPLGADTPARDADAAAVILRDAIANSHGLGSYSVDFRYTLTDGGVTTSKDGAAFITRAGFRVAYDGLDYYGNGRYVWVHHHPVDRVFIYDYKPGVWWDAERLFLYDWTKAEIKEFGTDANFYRIVLKIEEPEGDLFQADLWIGVDDGLIQRAILYGQDGRLHSYEVKEYHRHLRVPRHVVNFQPRRHPDTELLPFTAEPYFEAEAEESY